MFGAEPGEGGPARFPSAWGDVFDRLTILRLKCSTFTNAGRIHHTRSELAAVADLAPAEPRLMPIVERLAAVNAGLWDAEDAIHCRERAGLFDANSSTSRGPSFIATTRAAVKREISILLGSALIEEKLYSIE